MNRSVKLTKNPIDEGAMVSSRTLSRQMGAVTYFSGIVREGEQGRKIDAIEYEAFEEMVLHQFNLILEEIAQKWPIESIRLIHRVGHVPVNESSLWVEVISPHRHEAFEACEWLINEMKKRVPIWKHPQYIED